MAEDQSVNPTGSFDGGGGLPTLNKWANSPQVRILRNERLKRNVLEINIDIDQKTIRIPVPRRRRTGKSRVSLYKGTPLVSLA